MLDSRVNIDLVKRIYLRCAIIDNKLQFYYSINNENWKTIGPEFDASKLSDEYCQEAHFTGAFAGICAQDLDRHMSYADFDYFEYREI